MIKPSHIAGLLWIAFSSQAIAENFKWKAKSPAKNFKCLSQEKGGFFFKQNGNHKLTRFSGNYEFYLTHITEIPDEAFSDSGQRLEGQSINDKKEDFEANYYKDDSFSLDEIILTHESGVFFIRKPNQNPKKYSSYYGNSCEYLSATKGNEFISCYIGDYDKAFKFDLGSGRFTYSYIGSWHTPGDEYAGDSAVIAFGECEEYYN